jgi:hypothetical protein
VDITALVFVSITIILAVLFGDTNLDRIKLTGPFQVGHREFRSETLGNEVSVFYPVDKVLY